jgi:hypothetical protein
MMLARITKDDARKSAAEFAIDDGKYVRQYRENEYVIVTEQGAIYRLSPITTGDSFKGVRKFTRPLDQQDFPSLEAAQGELKKRSLIPNVDRERVIADLMRVPGILDPTESPVRILLEQSLQNLAGGPGNIPSDPRRRIAPAPAVPSGANPHHLRINCINIENRALAWVCRCELTLASVT